MTNGEKSIESVGNDDQSSVTSSTTKSVGHGSTQSQPLSLNDTPPGRPEAQAARRGGSDDITDLVSASSELGNIENEEKLHEQNFLSRRNQTDRKHLVLPADCKDTTVERRGQSDNRHHHPDPNIHRHHYHHHHHHHDGHVKELIKPDPTVREKAKQRPARREKLPVPAPRIETAVDEEQLHRRLIESQSDRRQPNDKKQASPKGSQNRTRQDKISSSIESGMKSSLSTLKEETDPTSTMSFQSDQAIQRVTKSHSATSSSSSSSHKTNFIERKSSSPPPTAIIIPSNVAKSISLRSNSITSTQSGGPRSPITREQLEYGPLLRPGEVQVLYRSPELERKKDDSLNK